jgi:hypothetical protein
MQRITEKDLQSAVDRLNRITNSPLTYSDSRSGDGKFKSLVGHYYLDWAYCGVKLVRVSNECGGITTPIYMGFETKREAYHLIHAFINGVDAGIK